MNKIIFFPMIAVFAILVAASIAPLQLYPKASGEIQQVRPVFRWIGSAQKILVDDNYEFTSPIVEEVDGNSHQLQSKLNFTTYYWKLIGNRESKTRQFTVNSVVALSLKEKENAYELTNVGTSDLDIEKQESKGSIWKITGNLILRQNESVALKLKNSTLLVAKQR